jgi:hypothetical protein
MSLAADALRDFVTTALPGWRVQFGRWVDGNKADRFAVIRPVGGGPAELVRRPQFTVSLIGAENEAAGIASTAADALIEAMRTGSGSLVSLLPAEPVFMPTSDGRPIFEIAVSAITN